MISRKKIAIIYLPIIAAFPILAGLYQIVHFLDWLLELEIDFGGIVFIARFTPYLLVLFFIISLYERFCIYYRMVIIGILYAVLSCHYLDYYPSIYFYNITNIASVLLIFVGIIGCLIHFTYQIKDFIRYVRTKR